MPKDKIKEEESVLDIWDKMSIPKETQLDHLICELKVIRNMEKECLENIKKVTKQINVSNKIR